MFLGADVAVVDLGNIDKRPLESLAVDIERRFHDKWVWRSSGLMRQSRVLKAKTISSTDVLDQADADELFELLKPIVSPYVADDEEIVYLDVSSLPQNAVSFLHIDYMWIHMMSRRIRIPIVANPLALFATIDSKNEVSIHNLKVGKVYQTNNLILHRAVNYGPDRWHLAMDVMKRDEVELLKSTGRLDKVAFNPYVNACWDPRLHAKCQQQLEAYRALHQR